MKQKTENRKPITVKLFNVPISITSKSQALALIGDWLREYRSVISSRLSVIGSKSAGFQSVSPKPINRKPTNLKQKTENRKLITGYPKIIVTPNPEIIVAAQSDPELMKALQEADLSIPDGVGVVWALRLLGPKAKGNSFSPYPLALSRISGIDLMEGMILQGVSFKDRPLKVMLVGGRPGAAAKAARKCYELWVMSYESRMGSGDESPDSPTSSFPNSQLTTHNSQLEIRALSGPQDIESISKSDNDRLITSINHVQPDLLFVAFGHPRQEKWLMENRERLTVGVAMAVGGALDQIADPSLRPPAYINSIGLGWLYRLIRQPWRWKRQLALLKFVGMVIAKIINSQ